MYTNFLSNVIGNLNDLPFSTAKSSPGSPEPVTIEAEVGQKVKRTAISNTVTTILAPFDKVSPCASNESLTVDPTRYVKKVIIFVHWESIYLIIIYKH